MVVLTLSRARATVTHESEAPSPCFWTGPRDMWRVVEGGKKERRGQVQLSTFLYFLLQLNILPQGHPDLEDGGHVKP